MANDVKCTVSNCVFWSEGNHCVAPAILITSGEPTTDLGQPASKYGEESPRIEETPIEQIEQSYCYTFTSKTGPKE